jgi:hypothetical protein
MYGTGLTPGLLAAYQQACTPTQLPPPPCDGGASDASSDAGSSDAGCPPAPPPVACDDITVAFEGLHASDVWVTRLRADLPSSALDADLILEATLSQTSAPNVHRAAQWIGDPCMYTNSAFVPLPASAPHAEGSSCALASTRRESERAGTCVLVVASVLATSWLTRRRRRR